MRAIERYRDFIDSASDGIVVLDGSGAVLYLNRAAEEVTGYARDGLAGKPIVQIVPEPFRATLERQIGRAIAGEPIDNFDLELVTTSGDRITVSVASIGILSEHNTAIFSFRDVTLARELDRELRRTSEFLNRILNSTVDGIIAANMRGTILLFNQGAERHLRLQGGRRHRTNVGAQAVPAGHRARGDAPHPLGRTRRWRSARAGAPASHHRGRSERSRVDLGRAGGRRRRARDRDGRHLLGPARAPSHGRAARVRPAEAGGVGEAGASRWSWRGPPRTSSTSR